MIATGWDRAFWATKRIESIVIDEMPDTIIELIHHRFVVREQRFAGGTNRVFKNGKREEVDVPFSVYLDAIHREFTPEREFTISKIVDFR